MGQTMRALVSTDTSCWTALASGSDNSVERYRFEIGGGKAIMDSKPDVSLNNEEEHGSTDGTESSIGQ
jgi:hypothetical protein